MARLIKSEIEQVQFKQREICEKYSSILSTEQNDNYFLEEAKRDSAELENQADENIIAKTDAVASKLEALEKALADVKNAADELAATIEAAYPYVTLDE